jgi:hypothetical protein
MTHEKAAAGAPFGELVELLRELLQVRLAVLEQSQRVLVLGVELHTRTGELAEERTRSGQQAKRQTHAPLARRST